MRPYVSITQATALEVLSSPLSLLVLLAALAMEVFAPVFHYHQFGDATRMARDAAISALFTCGAVFAVFGAIRSVRREIETGTMEMALAHPVSRSGFFLAKAAGVAVSFTVFAVAVIGIALTMFAGAAVGGAIAEETAQLARVYGPCVAAGVAAMVLPLVLAAALNRFFRFRFPCLFAAYIQTAHHAIRLYYIPTPLYREKNRQGKRCTAVCPLFIAKQHFRLHRALRFYTVFPLSANNFRTR